MSSQIDLKPEISWLAAFNVYLNRRVMAMLFLGFSAGLPLFLIFSTLSLWLRDAGVDRSAVTYFSWAALAYSFKFIWAPVIDKLPLPFLHTLLGRRRSWLLVAQLAVIFAIAWMAMIDPAQGLRGMAFAAVLLGFSSASQDIVIDAYRIEAVKKEYQAAMSAMYIAGYRIGMLVSGAGGLYLASYFSTENQYNYDAWQTTYLIMAIIMLVGVVTTLLIKEPEINKKVEAYLHDLSDYLRFFVMFIVMVGAFIYGFKIFNFGFSNGFINEIVRLFISLLFSLAGIYLLVILNIVNRKMVYSTYVEPVVDFFKRYGKAAILLLLLVGLYRISDIVLGVIANVFYHDIGFSKNEIATTTKLFGIIMTLIGGFLGGLMTMRYGVMRILLLGAILSAVTNLLFMLLAQNGHDIVFLSGVIAADNLSAGLASAAFIAYLSSLTNISFTAVQYAILSSLMTLFPKLLGGYSGSMVNELGYSSFFLMTALLGVPVILLIFYLMIKKPNLLK
ncbi:MAG: MFS transporter [Gammaproteobacteria bacterium]|nr:MAG: MFS transporter [Gammaproteobacteria bacterium]